MTKSAYSKRLLPVVRGYLRVAAVSSRGGLCGILARHLQMLKGRAGREWYGRVG